MISIVGQELVTTFGSMEHCYCLPMKLQEGNVLTGVCLSTGACVVKGECMVKRGHAWQGVYMGGGMYGGGHAWQGVCMAGGHVSQGVACVAEGSMHGRGCA